MVGAKLRNKERAVASKVAESASSVLTCLWVRVVETAGEGRNGDSEVRIKSCGMEACVADGETREFTNSRVMVGTTYGEEIDEPCAEQLLIELSRVLAKVADEVASLSAHPSI